jgi:tetratricopeptide (TPR) repeat protein
MGAFFDSIHVRTENSRSVQKALEQIAKEADSKFLFGPALNGWTSIFPSDSGKGDEICAKISKLIPNDVFHLIVHDDDIFIYCFYRNAQLIDEYNSWPDSFEEVSEAEKQKCQGRPELFQDLLRDPKSLGKLKTLLNADKFTFESERMAQFVKLLGLSNALSSYDYLQSEDWDEDEIEGWKQFIQIENQPASAEDYNNRGEAKLAKGNLDGALADFKKAIELNPDLVAARDNCGRVELAKIDRDKTLAETWNKFGRIKKDAGELDSALHGYDKAIELNPNYAIAYSNRGIAKKAKGDFDGALTDFNKAIELKPDSATAYNSRGELKRSKGDLDGALADYDRAIELKPDSAIYFGNRALAKLRKHDLEGAFSDCNKAIELKSDYANAYNNRGMVKHVKGDLNGALEDYDKAIEFKPDFTAARTNRDKAKEIKNSKKL